MPVTSLDEVDAALSEIIDMCRATHSRLGYFAALYRRVTRRLKQGLSTGEFEDPEFMERLGIIFAIRYLDALNAFQSAGQPSRCWAITFQAATKDSLLVLEHLSAAMNAHIGFDLGMGIADAVTKQTLPSFRADFDRFNDLLAAETSVVAKELAQVSPVIRELERLGLRDETRFVAFSLSLARDLAWERATRLVDCQRDQVCHLTDDIDLEVELAGRLLVDPIPPASVLMLPLRVLEVQDVSRVIEILSA